MYKYTERLGGHFIFRQALSDIPKVQPLFVWQVHRLYGIYYTDKLDINLNAHKPTDVVDSLWLDRLFMTYQQRLSRLAVNPRTLGQGLQPAVREHILKGIQNRKKNIICDTLYKENKLLGLSPRDNYTDRATAACWRS
jgi:hypothetical protein